MKNLTLGSLFDGSGGFLLGGVISGITPLWASEIEPFPIRVTSKHFPNVKHLGDISTIDGAKIPYVDIITFGSPCQDMSVAGKRDGLNGSRSNLFYEAIRIIKEMRNATNGEYPKYIVWENVPGAFSSNKGEDFRSVLEEICKIKEAKHVIPKPPKGKWEKSGNIVGKGYSVAWRVLDAQYWGVPQRRKRIYLVADFAGGSAGKILFESEGLSGYSAESFRSWQRTAGSVADYTGTASLCLNDQGGQRMNLTDALRAESHHPPYVLESAGFCTEHSSKSRNIGYEEETSPTLRTGVVPAAVVLENHPADSRISFSKDNTVQTLTSRMGTGGGNIPLVMSNRIFTYGISSKESNAMKSSNPYSGIYEAETSRTLDSNGGNPGCNQGGIAVVESCSIQDSMNGRNDQNVPQDDGINKDVSFTLNTMNHHAMTIQSKYIVRRMTPTECARLQGFPDWWCDNLETTEPTEEELAFWEKVFETYRKIMGTTSKPKTEKQLKKWLANPHSDSAEYKMWGNGVALPCVYFVLSGIVWATSNDNT